MDTGAIYLCFWILQVGSAKARNVEILYVGVLMFKAVIYTV